MSRLVELSLVLIAVTIPQFALASNIDTDEFQKAGASVASAAAVATVYKLWRSSKEEK